MNNQNASRIWLGLIKSYEILWDDHINQIILSHCLQIVNRLAYQIMYRKIDKHDKV